MSLIRGAALLQAAKVIQQLSALVATIVLARAIGPAGMGQYAALLALAVVVQAATSMGFEDLTMAEGPSLGGDTRAANQMYGGILRARLKVCAALLALGVTGLVAAELAGVAGDRTVEVACAVGYAAANGIA